MLELTENNFNSEVLESSLPVLVDFWAPWCGPCKMIAPHVEQISKEYEGKLKVAKCNVDDNGNTATKYGISGIPALLLFIDGEVKETIVGAVPKKRILSKIEPHLG